mmetsp:Transcript_198/g.366  ORF Transcript_198/g.366 Transcript_198/m.366 type:complete len:223 (+) Transcript_198:218-886(+)
MTPNGKRSHLADNDDYPRLLVCNTLALLALVDNERDPERAPPAIERCWDSLVRIFVSLGTLLWHPLQPLAHAVWVERDRGGRHCWVVPGIVVALALLPLVARTTFRRYRSALEATPEEHEPCCCSSHSCCRRRRCRWWWMAEAGTEAWKSEKRIPPREETTTTTITTMRRRNTTTKISFSNRPCCYRCCCCCCCCHCRCCCLLVLAVAGCLCVKWSWFGSRH